MPFTKLIPIQKSIPKVKSSHTIINGKVTDFDITSFSNHYVVIICLTAAGHPITEQTMKSFSKAKSEFEALHCKLLAVSSNTTNALLDWLKEDSVESAMPIISDRNSKVLGELGVLHRGDRGGYPANAFFIIDHKAKVRYSCVTEPTIAHCPKEVSLLVKSFQATDDGDHLVMSGENLDTCIVDNNAESIRSYYQNAYTYTGVLKKLPTKSTKSSAPSRSFSSSEALSFPSTRESSIASHQSMHGGATSNHDQTTTAAATAQSTHPTAKSSQPSTEAKSHQGSISGSDTTSFKSAASSVSKVSSVSNVSQPTHVSSHTNPSYQSYQPTAYTKKDNQINKDHDTKK